MEYRVLGKTGVKVSELCFGTMSFGGDADFDTSKEMFGACIDAGVNFFDCANVYSKGRSEEILGKLMNGMRDDLVITSKVYGNMGGGINDGGLSRRHIKMQVEESLRRLNTDRLDVYFVHHYDADTAMEETLRALDDLVTEGKILYPGVSNWSAWQITKALGMASSHHLSRFEVIQPMYNLAKRQAEVEILPLALSEMIGVIPYSPLGGGLLTGKYTSTSRPESGRLVEQKSYIKRYGNDVYYEIADAFSEYALSKEYHPVTLAVAWVGSNPAVTAPIIGARNAEQLKASLAAADVDMTPEWRAEITALSVDPPPATDRLEEAT